DIFCFASFWGGFATLPQNSATPKMPHTAALGNHMELVIREFQSNDDLEKLTCLIHSAYAPHAASGLKYWGTHQTVEDTKKRIGMGICLVALLNGEYIGTGLFRRPQPESPVLLYREPSVWTLAQFCV